MSSLSNPLRWSLIISVCLLVTLSSYASQSDPGTKTVQLIVDYHNGVEKHFTRLPWSAKMTVLDAMKKAARVSHGIQFRHQGKGATAFLTQIDNLKNQGGGRNNWLYEINQKPAQQSFGVQELKPHDLIRWTFHNGSDN